MGVVITSVGTSYDRDSGSVVTHAARAVRQALTSAAVEPQEVGVLINTGVYRDSNTVEPAIAALIQKDAGIGLEYGEHDPRTFSFDLMNGACGVLNAVQVADAILSTGSTGRVLVVSGDTHPSAVAAGARGGFPTPPPARPFSSNAARALKVSARFTPSSRTARRLSTGSSRRKRWARTAVTSSLSSGTPTPKNDCSTSPWRQRRPRSTPAIRTCRRRC
ncbi:hypothetical protein GCM10020255_028270 [Rhodococcus baikonurensis]